MQEYRGYAIFPLISAGKYSSMSLPDDQPELFWAASINVAFASARAKWPYADGWRCVGSVKP